MTDRDKLPAKTTAGNVVQAQGQSGNLVARGLEAIERKRNPPLEAIELESAQLVENARQIAQRCATIPELEAAIRAFEGCPLKCTAKNTVFADGIPGAPVMVVGVAPGATEDRVGKPFVGISGQLMDRMFDAIGMSRERDLYFTNIFFWRWPDDREPTFAEQAICLAFTRRHIELATPKVLVLLGGITAKPLLNTTEGIMRLRGKWTSLQLDDGTAVPTLPTFHPAYLLRTPASKRQSWRDLLALDKRLRELGVRRREKAATPSPLSSNTSRPANSAARKPAENSLDVLIGLSLVEKGSDAKALLHGAAEQGDAWAQYMLGEAYHEGDGVAQDDLMALKWWYLAARQGLNEAQYQLGCTFSEGFAGLEKDHIQAYMWFRLAWTWESKNDFSKSASAARIFFSPAADQQCLLISRLMTRAQISEARRLAREWTEHRAS